VTETYKKLKIFLRRPRFITSASFSVAQGLLEGQEKVEDELCAGRPVTARTSEDMGSAQDLMVDSETNSG